MSRFEQVHQEVLARQLAEVHYKRPLVNTPNPEAGEFFGGQMEGFEPLPTYCGIAEALHEVILQPSDAEDLMSHGIIAEGEGFIIINPTAVELAALYPELNYETVVHEQLDPETSLPVAVMGIPDLMPMKEIESTAKLGGYSRHDEMGLDAHWLLTGDLVAFKETRVAFWKDNAQRFPKEATLSAVVIRHIQDEIADLIHPFGEGYPDESEPVRDIRRTIRQADTLPVPGGHPSQAVPDDWTPQPLEYSKLATHLRLRVRRLAPEQSDSWADAIAAQVATRAVKGDSQGLAQHLIELMVAAGKLTPCPQPAMRAPEPGEHLEAEVVLADYSDQCRQRDKWRLNAQTKAAVVAARLQHSGQLYI